MKVYTGLLPPTFTGSVVPERDRSTLMFTPQPLAVGAQTLVISARVVLSISTLPLEFTKCLQDPHPRELSDHMWAAKIR